MISITGADEGLFSERGAGYSGGGEHHKIITKDLENSGKY